MKENKKTNFLMPTAFLGLILLVYLGVWVKLYLNIYINSDLGWLLTCLDRFMQGGTYTDNFYETNPPLSFLIYLPAYPLYHFLHVDPSIALLVNFAAYIALSAYIIYRYMRIFKFSETLIIGLFGPFLFTQTWMLSGGFGQKDQLVYLFLIPYVMMQIAILADTPQPALIKNVSAFLGALSVCIKPHYLLIPGCILLYRAHKNRSIIPLIRSSDFIVFILTGLSYLAILNIFFSDFVNVILPETVNYYLLDEPFPVTMRLSLLLFAGAGFLISLFVYETEETKHLKLTLFVMLGLALLCVIPYLMQNKGFTYHTIPFFGFSVMSAMLAFYGLIYQSCRLADVSATIQFTVMLLLMNNYMTGNSQGFLSPKEFKGLPHNSKLEELAWNHVYTDLEMKPFNLSLPYYSDLQNGSRFGHLWPLHGLNLVFSAARTEKEKKEIKSKIDTYVGMIAEDIEKYKPSVISIPRYIVDGQEDQEPQKNYYNTLMRNEKFSATMANYEFKETFSYDEGLYQRGSPKVAKKMRTVDLFVLKKSDQNTDSENENEKK